MVGFINAGVQIALLREGVIDVPEYLSSWLEGDERTITKEKMGLLVR
ncbi:MAG: hypothetical protein OQJ98_01445 [Candidatus Pacebacteria bacterium]|nr:hypothetical protein [Candidatus Paceibacterota bacterium]